MQTTKTDGRYRPLYSCVGCSEDQSLDAAELRVLGCGDLICDNCYDGSAAPGDPEWGSFPPFDPDAAHRQEVARARAEGERAGESTALSAVRTQMSEALASDPDVAYAWYGILPWINSRVRYCNETLARGDSR